MKRIKCLLSALVYRSLLILLPAPKANCDDAEIAIVCVASLGDFVVSCFACRELFKQGKHLTLICRKGMGIEEFAKLTGYFKEIVSLPHKYYQRMGNLKRLRDIRVHTVLVMPPERHILSDLYALAITADERIFPDTVQGVSLPRLKEKVDSYADRLISVYEIKEQKRYEEYLQGAGLYHGKVLPFQFEGVKASRKFVEHPYIMVFPGAGGGEFKQWPVDRFAYVANQLQQEKGYKILVCGTENEKVLGDRLCRLLTGKWENLCGKTEIAELGERFEGTALVLANDSGSAHMSVAFGAPTVIICGGWEYGRFYPNEDLFQNCTALVAKKENFPCIPCGKSQAAPIENRVSLCVLAISQNEVLSAARYGITAK